MDLAGLSKRMEKTLINLQAVVPLHHNPTAAIDLSNAQNEVIWPELLEFYKTAVHDSVTSQTFTLTGLDSGGEDPRIRNALAAFFNTYFRPIHTVKPEHIVLTAGASDAIESIIHAVCDDGDGLIIPGPYWHGFDRILKSRANVNPIIAQPPSYEHWDNYLLPSIQAAYDFSVNKSRIKAVLLCNPHNPLSRCYPKDVLLGLMEFCQERDLHLIVDEMYALVDLNVEDDAPEFISALSLSEPFVPEGFVKIDPSRIHVVWSGSKLLGMTGFRVGCLVSQQNPQLLSAISLLTMNHTSNIASLYLSSLLAWSQLPTLLKLNSERLTISCRLLIHALRLWGIDFVMPTHGIFLFAKLAKNAKSAIDEQRFYDRLAMYEVIVAQGRFHKGVEGDFGWARIRFSVPRDVMSDAVERIGLFLSQADPAVEGIMVGL